MLGLIARRLVALVPVLLIVTFGVFMLSVFMPGDPAVTLAGGADATPERIEEIRQELNLDDPLLVRYGTWLAGAVKGDFGNSLFNTRETVFEEVRMRIPVTGGLALSALVMGLIIGVPAGVFSGVRPGGLIDRLNVTGISLGVAIPNFFLAMVLISVFAVNLQWLPAIGFTRFTESPTEWLRSMILPALSLALFVGAAVARQLRASLIDVMGSNYVRTAWAMGASPRVVVTKHALKNAAIPAITVLGMQLSTLLGGAVIIEQIFSIPGLGTYLLRALLQQDLPVVLGVTTFFVVIYVLMTLVVDLAYGFLNPKVRVS